jgi:sorbitol-specific phosphotransferase system component IIBC
VSNEYINDEVKAINKDIVQRDGRSGPMVFVIIEETYVNGQGEKTLTVTNTQITRQAGTIWPHCVSRTWK